MTLTAELNARYITPAPMPLLFILLKLFNYDIVLDVYCSGQGNFRNTKEAVCVGQVNAVNEP